MPISQDDFNYPEHYWNYQGADIDLVPGSKDFYESLIKRYKDGALPQEYVDTLIKGGKAAIGGQYRSGSQDLEESLASTGSGTPIDALVRGKATLRGNAGNAIGGLYDRLAKEKLAYKTSEQDKALMGYFGLLNANAREQDSINKYRETRYAVARAGDEEGFPWGELAGTALAAGGQVAAGTCFCYAEAFGNYSTEYLKARKWAMENTSAKLRMGYVKLSAYVIPLMRKYPKFKTFFKKYIALPCLKQMYDKEDTLKLTLNFWAGICRLAYHTIKLSNENIKTLNTVFGK